MPKADHQFLAIGFLQSLIWLTILGAIGLVGGNIVGSLVVPGHDFVADTVSDLAAGRYEIIQDVALYGFAMSLIALSLAAAHIHDGTGRWSALVLSLAALAVCVVVIGARNEYGDGDNEGIVIHIYIVYALGALFTFAFGITALDGDLVAPRLKTTSRICFVLWLVGAPVFFMLPTAYDGLWERGLGMISVVWAIVFALDLRHFASAHAAETR